MPAKPKVFSHASVGKIIKPAISPDLTWGKGRGGRPWRRICDRINERDGRECQECLRNGRHSVSFAIDHKIPRFEGGIDDDANLECICRECHKIKTAAESLRARKSKRIFKKGGVGKN